MIGPGPRASRRAGVALASLLVLAGCERDDGGSEVGATAEGSPADSPDVAEDRARIVRAIAEDPARPPLAEVDAAIDDDLPVRAAELLGDAAIPAARDAAAAARALEARTDEGVRLRDALAAAFEERVTALEQKARALERGVEDLALADAFRAERRAEEHIAAVEAEARGAGAPPGARGGAEPPR